MQNSDAGVGHNPLNVRSMKVRTGRLICEVCIDDRRYRYTTPALAAFVTSRYPDLPHHACVNGKGPRFGEVIEATSIAHMLEHIVISEQVRTTSFPSAEYVGTTEWIDEASGLARVEVSFRDDLEALRAFAEATRFLNIAVLTCFA